MDYRWGGVTYNNQSPYWIAGFSVKNGPVVVEIPPAREDARVFGSIHDAWFLPLEDFGPAGADKGIRLISYKTPKYHSCSIIKAAPHGITFGLPRFVQLSVIPRT